MSLFAINGLFYKIYSYLQGYKRSPKTGRKKTIFDFKMKHRKKSRKRAKKKSRRRKKSRKLNSRRRKKNSKRFRYFGGAAGRTAGLKEKEMGSTIFGINVDNYGIIIRIFINIS